jgi:hypothetical protein
MRFNEFLNEGEVVAFPKKHRGDISNMHSCPKCGGDTQGGKYQGHEVQVCMPCKQVYLPPNSEIDQQGNKIKEGSETKTKVGRRNDTNDWAWYYSGKDGKWKWGGPAASKQEAQTKAQEYSSKQGVAEEKVRLDPKCWTGKKIGNPKTKVKGGVRVNNCVPAESVNEAAKGVLHRVRYQCDDPSGSGIASGHITLHAPDKAAAARYAASDLSKKGKKNVKVLAVTPQKQGVAEGTNDYFKRRKDEEDRIAGTKAPAKRTPKQTDYEKKRKQQSVTEGQEVDVSAVVGKLYDIIDNQENVIKNADYDQQVRQATIVKDRAVKALNMIKSNPSDVNAAWNYLQNGEQGVAESYPKHQDLSGVSTDKLKAYLAKQSQQQVSGESNQVKRVRAELQRREQGVAENYNAEYDDEAGMADNNLSTLRRAVEGLDDLIDTGDNLPEWCQEKIAVAKSMLVAVWDYMESADDAEEEEDPEVVEMYEALEQLAEELAQRTNKDVEQVWETFEALDDHMLYETAAWRRKEGKSKTGGLNAKGVASYRRENPGSKLQTAVTTKPSKLKKGSKAAKRRKSFCARMSGVKGPMKKPNGKPTRKALALRKWNC